MVYIHNIYTTPFSCQLNISKHFPVNKHILNPIQFHFYLMQTGANLEYLAPIYDAQTKYITLIYFIEVIYINLFIHFFEWGHSGLEDYVVYIIDLT